MKMVPQFGCLFLKLLPEKSQDLKLLPAHISLRFNGKICYRHYMLQTFGDHVFHSIRCHGKSTEFPVTLCCHWPSVVTDKHRQNNTQQTLPINIQNDITDICVFDKEVKRSVSQHRQFSDRRQRRGCLILTSKQTVVTL